MTDTRQNNVMSLIKHFTYRRMSYCTLYYVHKEARRWEVKIVLLQGHTSSTAALSYNTISFKRSSVMHLEQFWQSMHIFITINIFRDKTITVSPRPKAQNPSFLAFILQLLHTNQRSHFHKRQNTRPNPCQQALKKEGNI